MTSGQQQMAPLSSRTLPRSCSFHPQPWIHVASIRYQAVWQHGDSTLTQLCLGSVPGNLCRFSLASGCWAWLIMQVG